MDYVGMLMLPVTSTDRFHLKVLPRELSRVTADERVYPLFPISSLRQCAHYDGVTFTQEFNLHLSTVQNNWPDCRKTLICLSSVLLQEL